MGYSKERSLLDLQVTPIDDAARLKAYLYCWQIHLTSGLCRGQGSGSHVDVETIRRKIMGGTMRFGKMPVHIECGEKCG